MREFAAFLDGIPVVPPSIPVVANVTGRPHDPAALKTTLARQIGSGVRWLDSMLFLLDQGATDFIEVGPGNVLTKLLQQIRKKREG
jgi:trans-AT polyketide synthase/acyltransferase/oxidoreductase domain-containing protein